MRLLAGAVVGLMMLQISSCGPGSQIAPTAHSGETTGVSAAEAAGARAQNPVPADAHSVQLGRAVYVKQCQSCHGRGGKGDGPAVGRLNVEVTDLTDPDVESQTDGELFSIITNGSKPMPSYRKLLTEQQRWHVVNYLRAAFGKSTAS
jgi:mono/diheme cytochrome c family protein